MYKCNLLILQQKNAYNVIENKFASKSIISTRNAVIASNKIVAKLCRRGT
jgi:hypothetical protein